MHSLTYVQYVRIPVYPLSLRSRGAKGTTATGRNGKERGGSNKQSVAGWWQSRSRAREERAKPQYVNEIDTGELDLHSSLN